MVLRTKIKGKTKTLQNLIEPLAVVEAFITHVEERSLGKYTRTPDKCVTKILVAQCNESMQMTHQGLPCKEQAQSDLEGLMGCPLAEVISLSSGLALGVGLLLLDISVLSFALPGFQKITWRPSKNNAWVL